MAELIVTPDGWLTAFGRPLRCALGRGGVIAARDKREGDGATPAGAWPVRRVLFRADREPSPTTRLPTSPITPTDGWCDAPGDALYNQPVSLPYGASAEALWRADGIYDLIVVLGHNEAPVTPGAGSAIFLHLARPDFGPTEGCVALARDDLLAVLAAVTADDRLLILGALGRRGVPPVAQPRLPQR